MSGPSENLRRATRLRLTIVLTVYVLAAALLPLAHHDLVCHLKSTTHCFTCVVGSSAESASDSTALDAFGLRDVGRVSHTRAQRTLRTPLPALPGRAPPSEA